MKLTNSQKNVSVDVPVGENPGNALQGLLRHAMNRTQTRASADMQVTAEEASALGIPSKPPRTQRRARSPKGK